MTVVVIIFSIVYLGMMLGHLPWLKIDRASIALVGAVALLSGHYISPGNALASVDFGTLALIFGLMLVSIQFELSGVYSAMSAWIGRRDVSPTMLLALITALAGVLAAFLTNDVVAVAMAPVVLGICVERKINPVPFLLGIAFATNSGAVATLVGSPQNMLIAEKLHLEFTSFALYTATPAILSLVVGWGTLVIIYRNSWELKLPKGSDCSDMKLRPTSFDVAESVKGIIVVSIVIGLFIFGKHDRGMVAITAGAFLLMNARYLSHKMIEKVDWNLLILFFGLFVVNSAMDLTGLPGGLVDQMSQWGFNLRSLPELFLATAILSDIVSNVPGVMLLLPYASDPLAGPLMAIASGLSSNLIVIGSLANIIVVDAAASRGLKISFLEFAKSGVPVSLVSMAIGALWVWLVA